MSDYATALQEAERRGILDPDRAEALSEARRRGLIATPEFAPQVPVEGTLPSDEQRQQTAQRRIPSLGERVRPGMLMTGGSIGGALGSPLGPPGMAAGGMLGAAAGSLFSDTVTDVENMVTGSNYPMPSTYDRLSQAGREAMLEGAFTAGTTALVEGGKAIVKGAGRKTLGIGQEAIKAADEARNAGVNLGISDVSAYPVVKGYGDIVGRWPFLGTPIMRNKAVQVGELTGAFDRTLENIGPSVTMSRAGIDLRAGAKKEYQAFRKQAKEYYDTFRELAVNSDVQIPTESLKKMVAQYEAAAAEEALKTASGGVIRPPVEDPGLEYVKQLTELPETIGMRQYERIVDDLDKLMKKGKNDGFKIAHLLGIKHGAEDDLHKLVGDPLVKDALDRADDYYANTIKIFETPTAQRIGRAEKGIFKVGTKKAGTLNEDELMRVAFNTKSPEAIADLRQLVGDDAMNKATGVYIRNAWDNAFQNAGGNRLFDADIFRKNLGLGRPQSAEYQSLKVALEKTGVKIEDLEALARAADRAFSQGMPDASAFVARRGVLGGAKSALTAAVPVLGAGATMGSSGAVTAGLGLLAGRYGSTVMSNPRYLRLLTASFNPQLPTAQRNALLVRLARSIGADVPEVEEDQQPDQGPQVPQLGLERQGARAKVYTLPNGTKITEDDLAYTAEQEGMTIGAVKRELGIE